MTLERLFKDPAWTQVRLAKEARVDQSTLSRLLRKKQKASVWLALRIEKATGGLVSAEEIPMSRDAKRQLAILRQTGAAGTAAGAA